MSPARKPSIAVAGMIAADPYHGGATWAVLQYLLGLERLGYDVIFVEPVDASKLLPAGTSIVRSNNARYLADALSSVGFAGDAALVVRGTQQTSGMTYDELAARLGRVDALLNVSGMLDDDKLLAKIPVRAYLDLDPAFVQLWHAQGIEMRFDAHTHFITVGLEIGSERCNIPTHGKQWITTLQPVVLDAWTVAEVAHNGALTTVANWRGYGSIEWDGRLYGQKAHSIREIIDLPRNVREPIVLAMSLHDSDARDRDALEAHGWKLVDPFDVAGTPERYRRFIQHSYAEIGIAKAGYVRSACGWFSDRSICYLASGRPVIAQDTGFSHHLPVGDGLLTFTSIEGALSACDDVRARYEHHRRAARELAESSFGSDIVLTRLLEAIGLEH